MPMLEKWGTEIRVNARPFGYQGYSDVAVSNINHGTVMTVYEDYSYNAQGELTKDIYFSVRNPEGTGWHVQGVRIGNPIIGNSNSSPKVVALKSGYFLIAWQTSSTDGVGNGDVHGVIMNPYGNALGQGVTPIFVLNQNTTGRQTLSDIHATADGGFVVTYDSGVRSYRATFNGDFGPSAPTRKGNDTVIDTDSKTLTTGPATLIALGNGALISAARIHVPASSENDGFYGIGVDGLPGSFEKDWVTGDYYNNITSWAVVGVGQNNFATLVTHGNGSFVGRIYAPSGGMAALIAEFTIKGSGGGSHTKPVAERLSDGRFVVAWVEDEGGTRGYEIKAQVFNENGTLSGNEISVNTTSTGKQYDPAIAVHPDGRFTISYTDDSTEDGGVLSQTFDPRGEKDQIWAWFGTSATGHARYMGREYADRLDGHSGDDFIWGMGGDDQISGFLGSDTLDGGEGNDNLSGSYGNDVLRGGNGNDRLYGNEDHDTLYGDAGIDDLNGGEGNDHLDGGADRDYLNGDGGNDTVLGGGGDDEISGGLGNDSLSGGGGNDYFTADAGADIIDGGADRDQVSYAAYSVSLTVNLTTGENNDGDTLTNIEDITGGSVNDNITGSGIANALNGYLGNDILRGLGGDDTLSGGGGNDILQGGAGADSLDGGAGTADMADYNGSAALTVSLGGDFENTGDARGDIFVSIENLNGTSGNDILGGNAVANHIYGGDGLDRLYGGAGVAADTLQGGALWDIATYEYSKSGAAIILDLSNRDANGIPTAVNRSTGEAKGDVFIEVEAYGGTQYGDTFYGADTYNEFFGNDGDDTLIGGSVADFLEGGKGNDVLQGGAGSDTMVGGEGIDIASYENSTVGLTASLADRTQNTGDAAGDWYSRPGFNIEIEGLTGGSGNDTLIGSSIGNVLDGRDGEDILRGYGGNDTLKGGLGNDSLEGGDDDDSLQGGANDDILKGGAGTDTLEGGTGNDTYYIDANDKIFDEGGDDKAYITASGTYSFHGTRIEAIFVEDGLTGVRVHGGAENNTITGNDNADTIYGFNGDDHLIGGDGHDVLYGGSHKDILEGGAGNDILEGGDGDDILQGGLGDDTYYADAGDSVEDTGGYDIVYATKAGIYSQISGGIEKIIAVANVAGIHIIGDSTANIMLGNKLANTLEGGQGNDILNGDDGDDILRGGEDNDALIGGAGNDELYGDDGDDILDGGSGDDILDGGEGNDILRGGEGNDTYRVSAGDDTYYLNEIGDLIDFGPSNTDDGIDSVYATLAHLNGQPVADFVQAMHDRGIENVYIDGRLQAVQQNGTEQGEEIYGTDRGDIIDGRGGDDIIHGLESGDELLGSGGNDTLNGAAGNDTLNGGGNDDELNGGADDDSLVGGDGNDVLNGGEGHDTLDGGDGVDTLNGGEGNDTYIFSSVDDLNSSTIFDESGDADTVVVSFDIDLTQTPLDGIEIIKIAENAANITLTGNDDANVLIGNELANTFNGGNGDDTLVSGGGADKLNGGIGDDTYVVTSAEAVITDTSGTDTVKLEGTAFGSTITSYTLTADMDTLDASAVDGDIALNGNGLDNLIIGNDADNTINGGAGDDTLDGGDGDDFLDGGDGDDFLDGGEGDDTYRVSAGNDTYILGAGDQIDFGPNDTDDGIDTVYATSEHLDGQPIADFVKDMHDRGIENVYVDGVLYAEPQLGDETGEEIFGTENGDIIDGRGGNDTIHGAGSGDSLMGSDGNDTLNGGGGNDTLLGGVDDDELNGGEGDDILIGGIGSDTLNGGIGNDTYVFDDYYNLIAAEIYDEGGTADTAMVSFTLDLTDPDLAGKLGNIEIIKIAEGAIDVTLTGNDDANTLVGNELSNTLIGAAGNDTLLGGDGDDTLEGGLNNDYLVGGNGSDSLDGGDGDDYLDSTGDSADTLRGGAGNDIYVLRHADDTVIEDLDGAIGGTDDTAYIFSETFGNDEDAIAAYVQWLKENGIENVFVDVDPPGPGGDQPGGGNSAPTGVEISNNWVREGARTGFTIGSLSAIDPDQGDTFTYKFVLEDGKFADTDGIFKIVGDLLQVADGTQIDFEHLRTHPLKIAVFDNHGNMYITEPLMRITVRDAFDEVINGTSRNDYFRGGLGVDVFNGGLGDDKLAGGYGSDFLTGGEGNDVFRFDTFVLADEFDTIEDFVDGEDMIQLQGDMFGLDAFAGGNLDNTAFAVLGTEEISTEHRILYDFENGLLYYDEDGSGEIAAMVFAMFTERPNLSAASFYII